MAKNEAKVPEGFLPVLRYPDGKEPGVPVAGLCKFGRLEFSIGDPVEKVPALPLKKTGEILHRGWDIPTRWVIDGDGQCWMDGAHGGSLNPVSLRSLIGTTETEDDQNLILGILGLPLEEPGWMKQARAAGWTPPKKQE